MKSTLLPLSLILCSFALTSCELFKPKSTEPEKPEAPEMPEPRQLIGRISSAPEGQNFILIQGFNGVSLPIGTVLTTRGADGRAANIKITGEVLGNFAAADLQSGELKVGDAVYLPKLKSDEKSTESSESTESQ